MKIALDNGAENQNMVKSYSAGNVEIGDRLYETNLVVSSQQIIEGWLPKTFSELTIEHIEQIISLSPEILLFGTGAKLHFPADEIIAPVKNKHIGLEIMDTGAACRCYNLLLGEGREVVAAMFMIETL